MINIKIPDNNIPEREYIVKFIISDYLGLDYNVSADKSNADYSICFDDCELIIKDCFFTKYPEALSYLRDDALPATIFYSKNEFTPEKDIPVIFGSDLFIQSDKKSICGIDIFASSFFMLTRWEEYLNKTRDVHNRFPGIESLAFKSHFLHRPVVNEYAEMLWNIMLKSGYKFKRRQPNFDLVLTHDIDEIFYPKSLRILAGDVIKRKSAKLLGQHLNFMFLSNPYDTFDFLMSSSESIGIKSHFYFMASDGKQLPHEFRYSLKSKLFKTRIEDIKNRGHIIGFHPGYYTYDNETRWSSEKKFLEETIGQEVIEGRQHYLRCDLITTLSIWNRNNMKIDSTFGYYDKEGFRCGTGEMFSVFDFLDRKQMSIKERPLIIMDSTLFHYQKYSLDKAFQIIEYYISTAKKYHSTITLLFHNDGFLGRWKDYSFIPYKRILDF